MPLDAPTATTRVELTAALVRRHQRDVWRHLRFLGAAPQVADDLTQETFVRLWRARIEDRGDVALAGWLRATARNLFFALGRQRRAGVELSSEAEIEAAWVKWTIAEGSDGVQAALGRCLGRLESRAQQALALRYGEGQSREAVAAALRMTVEGLKTLLRRSKQALLECVRQGRRGPDGESHDQQP